MWNITPGIFILLIALSSGALSPEVEELCNDYWDWRMQDMPQFATFVGIHDYDDMLDDVSEEAYLARYVKCEEFKNRTLVLEPTLTEDADIINIRVLQYELDTYMDNYELKGFYLPMNNLEGIQIDMLNQFGWMLKNTTEDYDKMISRLRKIPVQIDQIIDLMKAGVANNITYHMNSMDSMYNEISEYDVDVAANSPFWAFFEEEIFAADFTAEQIQDIQIRAKAAIDEDVSPAFHKLLVYTVNDYVTRPDIAVTSINHGQAYYAQLIYYHTSTNLDPEVIHNIGLKEVARITREMEDVIAGTVFSNMSVQEYSNMLRDDPHNYYNNSDDLIARFDEICYDIVPPQLDLVFMNIPTAELNVVANPSPDGAGAFYLTGSYDGSRPGVFYVNTYYPDSQPKYNMMTLSLHEANPGHHLQSSYTIESDDYPFFRRVMEDRNYGIAPSRFPMYTYYMEGWGLYSEALGFDMGLYNDTNDEYGHYSEEIFRACRLVVDTGMHALNWTRDEAIEFMLNNTASSRSDIESEVDRYITWPGQALAYKMGQLRITELRLHAENKTGDLFDIKEFHDVILRSMGPMELVADEVNKWIIDTIKAPPKETKPSGKVQSSPKRSRKSITSKNLNRMSRNKRFYRHP